ncbi:MAG: tail fiber domain-containing protein, partial [Anaerolineae bacterium]|nr:tail fiber domain-containing protein [Anaerolineae bacterium]
AAVTGGHLNTDSGDDATVDGGWGTTALGTYRFAAGLRAQANHNGAFVWGDATSGDISSPAPNTFIVRANGGFWFGRAATSLTPVIGPGIFISTSTGAHLTVGGAWSNASDRNAKENFVPVNGEEILARLAEIPIQTWNYQAEDAAVRHVGPTAQDFYAAFGVGNSDTSISTVDAEGVALAAIQGLYQMVQEKDVQIAAQQEEIDKLAARLAAVEEAMGKGGAPSRHGEPGLPGGWPLLGGLLVVGLVLWPRARAGGR